LECGKVEAVKNQLGIMGLALLSDLITGVEGLFGSAGISHQ